MNYREGAKAYRTCSFKKTDGSGVTDYEPDEISGYGFENGKFFESHKINHGDSRVVAFTEVKTRGVVSLYKFDYSFFAGKTGDSLSRLYNTVVEKQINGNLVEWNSNEFIAKLNWLLFDCAEVRGKIQKVRLVEKELISLIEDYNKCKGGPVTTFNTAKPWMKVGFGFTGGIMTSTLKFITDNIDYRHLKGSTTLVVPSLGVSLDIFSPRLSERLSFQVDMLYARPKYQLDNVLPNAFSTERNYVTIEIHQLRIPAGVRYTFPERKFTPYINIGISSTLTLNSKSNWIQELEGNANDVFIRTDKGDALKIKSNQIGFWGGFGVSKSINNKLRAFVEIRYEHTDGISSKPYGDYKDFRSTIDNYQFVFGVRW